MWLEDQCGLYSLGSTLGIGDCQCLTCPINCKLAADCHGPNIWDIGIPHRKAIRISVVSTLVLCRIQGAMEIHLFTRIRAMDVRPASRDVIRRILHTEDVACCGFLCYSDRVPQTPTKNSSRT